jgi:hypothetical protein
MTNDKPKVNSMAQKELDTAAKQFDNFDSQVKEMTQDRMNLAPRQETEPQTKLSSNQIRSVKDHYLKPKKTIAGGDKFNEKYREQYDFSKTYVAFIAENNEVKGEELDLWTKPFSGVPAEEWIVPVNTPVWGPRYLAEQIKRKYYHRLTMQEDKGTIGSDHAGKYTGQIVVDSTVQRLDARPVNHDKRSIFMGA